MFFLKISDYQDTDAREENNEFLVENSPTSAMFSFENLMQENDLVVAGKKSLKIERKHIK